MASSHANVGKSALLEWINGQFGLGYTKIEECASGAFYCQVMDCLYPGKIPLEKVNFNARLEHEFLPNYKILQTIFTKENITKAIDVTKLTKGKFQDNLEFLQWLKGYYNTHYMESSYSAVDRRKEAGHREKLNKKAAAPATLAAKSPAKPVVSSPTKKTVTSDSNSISDSKPVSHTVKSTATKGAPVRVPISSANTNTKVKSVNQKRLEEVTSELVQLKELIQNLNGESKFFYDKLRDVEILCQDDESEVNVARDYILEMLCHSDDPEFTSTETKSNEPRSEQQEQEQQKQEGEQGDYDNHQQHHQQQQYNDHDDDLAGHENTFIDHEDTIPDDVLEAERLHQESLYQGEEDGQGYNDEHEVVEEIEEDLPVLSGGHSSVFDQQEGDDDEVQDDHNETY